MSTKNYSVENTAFTVMISDVLTDLDRKVLLNLYLPIIGDKALNIYYTFYTFINPLELESGMLSHSQILNTLRMSNKSFVQERIKLEAVGLLETYYKDNVFIYNLKSVLLPYEFFNNKDLVWVLNQTIGKEELDKLAYEFLLRRIDQNGFENITAAFDEVFDVVENNDNASYNQLGFDNRNNGIVIDNKDFNFEHFILLVDALNIVNDELLNSTQFLDIISRYAFLYNLSVEQLKDAVVMSVNVDKSINFDELNMQVRRIFDNRNTNIVFVQKKEVVKSSNKLINALNKMSPNDIVKNKYQVELTSTEIDMFDKLLRETNVSIGVLNVAVLYVVSEKNGEIPSYNYFLKVINTWKRAGITTTEEALNHINGVSENKTKGYSQKNKNIKAKPDWYKKEEEGKKESKGKEEELENDILDFFKPKK